MSLETALKVKEAFLVLEVIVENLVLQEKLDQRDPKVFQEAFVLRAQLEPKVSEATKGLMVIRGRKAAVGAKVLKVKLGHRVYPEVMDCKGRRAKR